MTAGEDAGGNVGPILQPQVQAAQGGEVIWEVNAEKLEVRRSGRHQRNQSVGEQRAGEKDLEKTLQPIAPALPVEPTDESRGQAVEEQVNQFERSRQKRTSALHNLAQTQVMQQHTIPLHPVGIIESSVLTARQRRQAPIGGKYVA